MQSSTLTDIFLRRATPEDESFLFRLYCAVRAPEFELLPLAGEQKTRLVRMQFTAQREAYRASYPGSDYEIVQQGGHPIGRIWIERLPDAFWLVDIALLPEACNHGVGAWLLAQLQAEAKAAGKPLRSIVSRFNPGSYRFHQRLGFRLIEEDEVQYYLEWTPDGNTRRFIP